MFRKWRSCLSLLVCVCFTLSMLFLDTLQVDAATTFGGTQIVNHSFYMTADMSTGSASVGTFHYVEPIDFQIQVPSDFNVDFGGYYYVAFNPVTFSFSNNVSVSNFILRDRNGNVLSNSGSSTSRIYKLPVQSGGSIFEVIGSSYYYTLPLTLEYDVSLISYSSSATVTTSHSFSLYCRAATSDEITQSQTPVTDISANGKLNDIQTATETTATTTTSIFDSITDFFGSFFENIINSLKSLFIPEDGYFTNWFSRLNTLLEAKLGMLYAPFGLIIDLLLAIMNADTTDGGIPIPELSIEIDGQTYVILQAQTFTFASLGERFNDLRDKVYFATDTVIIFAFLMLLQAKVRHIICDYESG